MCALVTGVQTCALPIYHIREHWRWQDDSRSPQCPCRRYEWLRNRAFPARIPARPSRASWRPPAAAEARLDFSGSLWSRYRSEEHTSELPSLMRISYGVFRLKKQKPTAKNITRLEYKRQIQT